MIPACEYVPLDLSPRPLVGWRCWFVFPHEGLLRPIYKRGIVWKPRQAMEATCADQPHDPPDMKCKCGIWSTSDPRDLQEIHWTATPPDGVKPLPGVLVVGQIALWGHCIEHERGVRASHAYPKVLYVFSEDVELAATLRDRYLVPVEYGERATALRDQLLPAPEYAPRRPAAAAPPPPKSNVDVFTAVARKALASKEALRDLTITLIQQHSYQIGSPKLSSERSILADHRQTLRRAIERGHYHPKTYDGDEWKPVLRQRVRNAVGDVIFARAVARAAEHGDETARRRVMWLLLARRWRKAQEAYRRAVKAQRNAERTHSKRTGEPLSPGTIGAAQNQAVNYIDYLDSILTDLAGRPTPTYAEWRRLFR